MQLGSWSPDLHKYSAVICLLFSCHSRDHSATTPRPVRTVTGGFGSDRFPALCPAASLPLDSFALLPTRNNPAEGQGCFVHSPYGERG